MTALNHPHRILYSMIRVSNLEKSISFYSNILGMNLQRKEEYPEGGFTLAFLGYGDEVTNPTIELTYNWGVDSSDAYEHGSAFGHIALAVKDIHAVCKHIELAGIELIRAPGPMKFKSPNRTHLENIAFFKDPDGYRIELVED